MFEILIAIAIVIFVMWFFFTTEPPIEEKHTVEVPPDGIFLEPTGGKTFKLHVGEDCKTKLKILAAASKMTLSEYVEDVLNEAIRGHHAPETITVNVLEAHINHAKKNCSNMGAMAIWVAIWEMFPSCGKIEIDEDYEVYIEKIGDYKLPEEVIKFIQDMKEGKEVKPFSFTMTLIP